MTSPVWRKSSRSTEGTTGDCVEVAGLCGAVGLRDSKSPLGGHHAVSRTAFARLVQQIKVGDLDR
jgi:hypothetical protein